MLERELAAREAELAVERSSRDEWLASGMKTVSTEALDANSARFLELAETHLTGHVRPLKDSLERMDQQLRNWSASGRSRTARCRRKCRRLSERTGSLTNALRTPHVRGRWGETQLRNVVEYAGMVEHCDYVTQATVSTDDGTCAPISSCASRAGSTSSSTRRRRSPRISTPSRPRTRQSVERHFADHARQVREHIGEARPPRVTGGSSIHRPDFVVMFLPDESYLRVAHEHDTSLQEYAWSSNVILASPSTLMILLRTVSVTWQQETLAESARGDLGSRPRALQAPLDDGHALLEARALPRQARSTPTTRLSALSSGRCCPRRDGSNSTGSPVSSRRSCSPIERQTRPLAARGARRAGRADRARGRRGRQRRSVNATFGSRSRGNDVSPACPLLLENVGNLPVPTPSTHGPPAHGLGNIDRRRCVP